MNSKKEIEEHSKKLEKLGTELSKIQYDFKIKEKPSKKYWVKQIEDFEKYHKKTIEYFTQSFALMRLANQDDSEIFILRINKLKQLGEKLLEDMNKVKENPAVMDSKDKQQSKWSIQIRENLIKSNNDCLNHEKKMNIFFREFYEKNLK